MSKHLIFDIETVPDVAGIRVLLADELPDSAALADEALILAFWKKRRPNESEESLKNLFMPIALHRVVTIACALFDEDWQHFSLWDMSSLGNEVPPDEDETRILQRFFEGIQTHTPQLVSWNGSGFDLPVLHHRAMMRRVRAGRYWELGDHQPSFRYNNYINRYHFRHLDLMDVLSAYNGKNFTRLDEMAKLCGLPGKRGMEGSMVALAYGENRLGDIANYCKADVLNTALLYLRFLWMAERIDETAWRSAQKSIKAWIGKQTDAFWEDIKID